MEDGKYQRILLVAELIREASVNILATFQVSETIIFAVAENNEFVCFLPGT